MLVTVDPVSRATAIELILSGLPEQSSVWSSAIRARGDGITVQGVFDAIGGIRKELYGVMGETHRRLTAAPNAYAADGSQSAIGHQDLITAYQLVIGNLPREASAAMLAVSGRGSRARVLNFIQDVRRQLYIRLGDLLSMQR
jgi:hypothetical protein